jgi:hypothetical protein
VVAKGAVEVKVIGLAGVDKGAGFGSTRGGPTWLRRRRANQTIASNPSTAIPPTTPPAIAPALDLLEPELVCGVVEGACVTLVVESAEVVDI